MSLLVKEGSTSSKLGVGHKPVWPRDKPRMLTELGSGGPWRPGTEGRPRANRRGAGTSGNAERPTLPKSSARKNR